MCCYQSSYRVGQEVGVKFVDDIRVNTKNHIVDESRERWKAVLAIVRKLCKHGVKVSFRHILKDHSTEVEGSAGNPMWTSGR